MVFQTFKPKLLIKKQFCSYKNVRYYKSPPPREKQE